MSGETKENQKGCDNSIQVPPKALHCDTPNDAMLSSLTATFKPSPGSPTGQLSASNMGLPPTPPCRMLKFPGEVAMEEGYDSDGQLGPFL